MAAIVASAKGHNFVLDGPPGTGKSQTIANMIAHNLALGRRVLFVAEKMAALDVVKRRLDQKGVGQFCLELHSNKTSKTHVLQQLDRAWDTREQLSQEDWEEQANKVLALRNRLNGFVKVLHRRWPNGWTIQNAIGLVIKEANPSTPNLSWPAGTEHIKADMEAMRAIARRLDLNKSAVEEINGGFSLLINTEWSNAWQASLVDSARHIVKALLEANKARDLVVVLSGLPLKAPSVSATELYALVR
ncbi:AAA domain-containing protein, partial [Acidithiobacillus caldus]